MASAGITINGQNPWDPRIHNEQIYDRVFSGGTLAVGESYMDGWWDVEDLFSFFFRLFHKRIAIKLLGVGIGSGKP